MSELFGCSGHISNCRSVSLKEIESFICTRCCSILNYLVQFQIRTRRFAQLAAKPHQTISSKETQLSWFYAVLASPRSPRILRSLLSIKIISVLPWMVLPMQQTIFTLLLFWLLALILLSVWPSDILCCGTNLLQASRSHRSHIKEWNDKQA